MTDATSAPAPSIWERLGWRADRRPEPGFAHVLGAGAGAFAVFAMVALVIEVSSDDVTLPGVLFSLALGTLAVILGMRFAGPIKSASVTVIVLVVPLLWAFALAGDGSADKGSTRGIYLLSVVTYAAFYFLVWTRGRAVLLALGLLLLFAWIVAEVEGSESTLIPFQTTFENQSNQSFPTGDSFPSSGDEDFSFGEQPDTTGPAAASFILGLGALAAGFALDRAKRAGMATPFIAVGALYGIIGGAVLGFDESVIVGGLLIAATGAVVGLVGGLGEHRRGSTWIGVITVVVGLSAVIGDIADSTLGFAGLAAAVAAGLGFLALWAAPKLNEHPDGDEKAPAKPAAT